tara:strand:+ start:1051 stop:1305 length:255 start_codon:yes stop_codon:yes gene_type:complete
MSTDQRNQKIGLGLFAFYLLLYGGFVLLMAFDAQRLQVIGPAGVNLAVWSGFGLIIVALILSLLYGWVCRAGASEAGGDEEGEG